MKPIIITCLLFACNILQAQDSTFARHIVDTLSSEAFFGRGYVNDGMKKAANFLAAEFKHYGLHPMYGSGYVQEFSYPVNTFPGQMSVSINNKALRPGYDFIISPESRGAKGKGRLEQVDSVQYVDRKNGLLIKLEDKLTWSVAPEAANYTAIMIDKKAIPEPPRTFEVDIENKFVPRFKAANVCGLVKGTLKPDSFLFITAHYDHLGGLGDQTFFPGANDNASGVALLLSLARHYAENPPAYSIGFVLFAGEEAGLIGSKYFTDNPLTPLKSIRFLLNTDLAGTGIDGITVVNATEFPSEFALMQQLNADHNLLTAINARGKAANSDHYFFTEKGVPAFFFYTLGGIKAYHDVYDRADTLPLTEHVDLLKLITMFNTRLMGR